MIEQEILDQHIKYNLINLSHYLIFSNVFFGSSLSDNKNEDLSIKFWKKSSKLTNEPEQQFFLQI
jgi:hypothetical protein